MADLVRYECDRGVAVLTLAQPPLNMLGQPLRAALAAAFDRAAADPGVGAIILTAEGQSWPVGADIREFGRPAAPPLLPDVLLRIAGSAKPVIAALRGSVLGGGLELALVAAFRVAVSTVRLGLPEITLGLIPGAGGTQRLPRLVGADAALDLMLTGTPVTAERALQMGLIDLVVNENPEEAARRRALDHVSGRRPLATAGARAMRPQQDATRFFYAIEDARAFPRPARDRAARAVIDCVEAALLLPPALGLAKERAMFDDLAATPEARALRHMFFAERQAARTLPAGQPLVISHVGVVGGGGIGTGLVTALLRKGLPVTLIEADAAALTQTLTRIARAEEAAVQLGERTEAEREAAWARLDARHGDHAALRAADLVIEATVEDQAARLSVLAQLGGVLPHDVPILSVTSALDPQTLADATGDPSLHASLYLTEPVRRVTLAELATAAEAGPVVIGAAQALARLMGWRLLRPGPEPGFLGRRLATSYRDAGDRCLAQGAHPIEVDQAARAYGLANGPFELADLFGPFHPQMLHAVRRDGVAENPVTQALRAWLVASDRLGRRAGAGWHNYRGDGSAGADPVVQAEANQERRHIRLAADQLARRLWAAMANEGAWMLLERRARRPFEVDLVAVANGYPRWRGGPMQTADEAGLLSVRNDLRSWADETGDAFWSPAPLWDDLIRNGRRFGDLNEA